MSSEQATEQRLRDALRSDIHRGDLWQTLTREMREIRDFYISQEKKEKLHKMGYMKRAFYYTWWIFKSMLLKLTPFRRILLVIGIFLVFFNPEMNAEGVQIRNVDFMGSLLVLLVLMLELKDKLLARDELEAGRKVQQALMPERNQSLPGWVLWIYTRPANEVGGDLVDFLSLDSNSAVVTLADVSGKGLKAALLTAKIQATVRALAPDFRSLSKLVAKINAIFHRDRLPNFFASLLYVELKSNSGKVRYVNAGHYPPVLLHGAKLDQMEKGEAALGIVASTSYKEQTVTMKKDETFVAYSDGVTEACNMQGQFFGAERLMSLLSANSHLSPQSLGEKIVNDVDRFVGDAYRSDDLSLVIVKKG
ncbi:MAG TPA: PP2C family protein-serine/threonine phosphatase [Bacteroidota bacterium]